MPYKNFDQNSIMWGVGSNKLQLTIPQSAPEGIKLLLQQCWSIKPRNRPSFSHILKHLEIVSETEILLKIDEEYLRNQAMWQEEIKEKMNFAELQHYNLEEDLIQKRKEELKHATDIRELYEQKLEKANNLYFELSTVLLQLDEREHELIKRERALNIRVSQLIKVLAEIAYNNLIVKEEKLLQLRESFVLALVRFSFGHFGSFSNKLKIVKNKTGHLTCVHWSRLGVITKSR